MDDLDMAEVLKLAESEGLDPTAVEAGIRKVFEGLQDLGVCQEISQKDVKERGLNVIDSRLVLKEKNGGVKVRLSDSQNPADSRTQKRLEHESDRFCARR